MSDLIITPVQVEAIKPHPNADRLELAVVGGWEIITGKGNYQPGDTVVHIPPDVMVPRKWADEWDVAKYLSWRKNVESGRVRAAKLRGVVSFGFLVPNESGAAPGADLAEHYGIEKYEPTQHLGAGRVRSQHPLFHKYTDIQNLRNFKQRLNYGIPLVVTEKIHGTNSRVGWVRTEALADELLDEGGLNDFVIGTHNTQRDPEDCGMYGVPNDLHGDAMAAIACWLAENADSPLQSVLFFGEIYGAGVQKGFHYGQTAQKGYCLFDISVNGNYLPWNTLKFFNEEFGIPLVPVLSKGVFTFEDLLELAEGDTTLEDAHIREGIVVRPADAELTWGKGDRDPNPKRMIFKVVSGNYLARKGGTEFH